MSIRRSKDKKVNQPSESEACDERLAQTLSAKFKSVTKVANLIPYLLEDDRIACQYVDPDAASGFKLLPGGYYRFYNSDEGMIYLSPFKLTMQLSLLTVVGKKIQYHKWAIRSINRMYIRESTEERIRRVRTEFLHPTGSGILQRSGLAPKSALQRASSEPLINGRPVSPTPAFTVHVRNAPPGYSPGR